MDIYAAAHKLEPQRAEATDSQGMLCYDGLTAGLYLVKADDLTTVSYTHLQKTIDALRPETGEKNPDTGLDKKDMDMTDFYLSLIHI